MKRIYLDHAATTPIDSRVLKAMQEFDKAFFGNPNSQHREGQANRSRIDFAREQVANFLNAKPQEIIFTSGATEANNLAIQGVVSEHYRKSKIKPHIVSTLLEHQSVYNTLRELEEQDLVDVSFVKPKEGNILPEDVLAAVNQNTKLISMIFVSNEIGSILPVREVAKLLQNTPNKTLFHIDAVQAVKFLNCNVEKLGCDLLTLSAHKIYGPKGIAALYVKSGTKLEKLCYGGSQEYDLRPGTQNISGIIGLSKALELMGSLEDRQKNLKKISVLRDRLITGLSRFPKASLNGPEGDNRIADNVNFTFYGIDQDALMTAIDLEGIAVSTGSACVSGSSEPSHVIKALGKLKKQPAATVRLTLGKNTTKKEIDVTIKTLSMLLAQLNLSHE